MARIAPACDKHKNLQMIESWIKTPAGRIRGYICAVPGCTRRHDGKSFLGDASRNSAAQCPNENRLSSVRNAILKAINHR
jgi:hypothetical protein